MMRRLPIVTVVSLAVAGCASQHAMQQITQDCQSDAANHHGMRCARNHPSFTRMSPDAQRVTTYGVMLEEQRNAGKITQAEADYLMREYTARIEAQQAVQAQAASNAMAQTGATLLAIDAMNRANYRQPVTTTCSPFVGSLRCTSY